MMDLSSPPTRSRWPAVILILVTAALFGRAIGFDFLSWDDTANVSENARLIPPTAEGLWYFWRHDYFDMYIPVTFSFWWLAALFSGWFNTHIPPFYADPAVFHFLNVLVHGLNGLLVYRLLSALLEQREPTGDSERSVWPPFIGALLFLVHPLAVEVVCCVSNFRDLLSLFFALATWLAFLKSGRRSSWPTLVLYACSLLSKPSSAVLPALIWITELSTRQELRQKLVRSLVPLAVLAGISLIGTKILQPDRTLTALTPLWLRPAVALDSVGFYLSKLFVPDRLTLDYGRTTGWLLESKTVFWSWIPAFVIFAGAYWQRRRLPDLWKICLLMLAALAPVLSLVPFVYQNISNVSDRYFYPAMLGPALGLALLVRASAKELRRFRAVLITTLAVLLAFLTVSFFQVPLWANTESLFTNNLRINPHSATALTNLGRVYGDRGDHPRALELHQAALHYDPHHRSAMHNIGVTLYSLGRDREAVDHYKAAVLKNPKAAEYRYNLAFGLGKFGRVDEAAEQYQEIIKRMPDSPLPYWNLGLLYLNAHRFAEAIAPLRKALELDPKDRNVQGWLEQAETGLKSQHQN